MLRMERSASSINGCLQFEGLLRLAIEIKYDSNTANVCLKKSVRLELY